MGITLLQNGIGDADISWGSEDFAGPIVRIFYSVVVNQSQFNGKYIANNLPPRLHHAGQVTLLHSGYVVHHEFVQFFKRDLGVFCFDPSYRQTVNIYPDFHCADSDDCPPGTPDYYELQSARKPPSEAYFANRQVAFEAQNPDASPEEIEAMVKCGNHYYIGEIAPFKLGLLKCVNQVFIEVFSPGISLMVEIAE